MSYQNSFKEEFDRVSPLARLLIVEAMGRAIQNPDLRDQSFAVEEFSKLAGVEKLTLSDLRPIVREVQQVLASFESGSDEDLTFHSWNIFEEIFIIEGKITFRLTDSMYSLEMAILTLLKEPRYHEFLVDYDGIRRTRAL